MYIPTHAKAVCALSITLWLSACSLAPDYRRPDAPVPQAVSAEGYGEQNNSLADQPPGAAAAVTDLGWRQFFMDAQLQALIAESLQHNKDLKLATLAVAQARAQYGVQNADRFPQLSAEGSDKVSGTFRVKGKDSFEPMVTVPVFELDFFGRVKNMSESALEKYLASQEAAKTARLTLISQVAQAWLEERLAREKLTLAQDTVQSWQASFAFMDNRLRSGRASLLELEQARGLVSSARAAVAEREQDVTKAANALRLLVGSFEKQALPEATPLENQSVAQLPASVASTALLRRPDIMEAEHNLKASNADIGVARAAFFPSISITGNLGYASGDLTDLFTTSVAAWSFLPKLTLPLFTAGKNKSNLDLAKLRKESSVVQYEKTIQTAFREVADALMTKKHFADQLEAQKNYLAAQRRVLNLATSRYTSGAVSYLEVLDAQRNVFQASQDLLTIRRNQMVNDINLYSALGGGLEENSPSAAPALQ